MTGLVRNFLMHFVRGWHLLCGKENTISNRLMCNMVCLKYLLKAFLNFRTILNSVSYSLNLPLQLFSYDNKTLSHVVYVRFTHEPINLQFKIGCERWIVNKLLEKFFPEECWRRTRRKILYFSYFDLIEMSELGFKPWIRV